MSEDCTVSRRASLKTLGIAGAAIVFRTAAEASAAQPEPEPAKPVDGPEPSDPVELAVARFAKNHSCAQAVFSAFAEPMGIDYQTAIRLSAGFGGGMGMGSVCGTVTGAIMAIGLKYGGTDAPKKEQTAKLVKEFINRFKARHPSLNCRDLLGCDPNTPEGRQTIKEKNLRVTICQGVVSTAAQTLKAILAENG